MPPAPQPREKIYGCAAAGRKSDLSEWFYYKGEDRQAQERRAHFPLNLPHALPIPLRPPLPPFEKANRCLPGRRLCKKPNPSPAGNKFGFYWFGILPEARTFAAFFGGASKRPASSYRLGALSRKSVSFIRKRGSRGKLPRFPPPWNTKAVGMPAYLVLFRWVDGSSTQPLDPQRMVSKRQNYPSSHSRWAAPASIRFPKISSMRLEIMQERRPGHGHSWSPGGWRRHRPSSG